MIMNLLPLQRSTGLLGPDIEELVEGVVTLGVAGKLGVSVEELQGFVDGEEPSPSLARLVGLSSAEAFEVRQHVGREGAVGLIMILAAMRNRAGLYNDRTVTLRFSLE